MTGTDEYLRNEKKAFVAFIIFSSFGGLSMQLYRFVILYQIMSWLETTIISITLAFNLALLLEIPITIIMTGSILIAIFFLWRSGRRYIIATPNHHGTLPPIALGVPFITLILLMNGIIILNQIANYGTSILLFPLRNYTDRTWVEHIIMTVQGFFVLDPYTLSNVIHLVGIVIVVIVLFLVFLDLRKLQRQI